MTKLSYTSVNSSRAGEADNVSGPGSGQPTGIGTAPVFVACDGVMVVMQETDVTAKTVLGEPVNGSADQSEREGASGLRGPGSDCCAGSGSSCSICVDIIKSSFRMDPRGLGLKNLDCAKARYGTNCV